MIAKMGQAFASERDQAGAAVNSERSECESALGAPFEQTFQQVAVGAADVEQVAAGRDGVQDRCALGSPPLGSTTEAGLFYGVGFA